MSFAPSSICPQCGRPAPVVGDIVVDGVAAAVYQCEECYTIERHPNPGDPSQQIELEVACTWAIDAAGRTLDPSCEERPGAEAEPDPRRN